VAATAFTRLAGCELPVQQAPMGAISPPALALAVARAGGVGTVSLPIGSSATAVAALLDPLGAPWPGALAANVVTDRIDPEAIAAAAERVRIVDFFWSYPDAALVAVAHAAGALVNWQVGSQAEAVAAAGAGADLVTVQGTEAGGHVRGDTPLPPLLDAVLAAVDVPVLAAGGIADAASLAAVLAAGAAGARVGTRFIASVESGAHPEYVRAVLAAGPGSTEITGGFAVCPLCAWRPTARVLSSAVRAVADVNGDVVGHIGETALPVRAGLPPHRDVRGEIAAMALYAGEGVHLVSAVEPAATIVRSLVSGPH
jgi:NAD(P)H-dependent flavin oxidoreductase YrpB (nitropropane dioxygenase family)